MHLIKCKERLRIADVDMIPLCNTKVAVEVKPNVRQRKIVDA